MEIALCSKRYLAVLGAVALISGIAACASTKVERNDPLQYTKKLTVEGHVSLYENGAFQVPRTQIRLIPAGPSAYQLAAELMGMRARQSFLTAVRNAADSVYIVSEGTKLTYRTTKKIGTGTRQGVETIRRFSRENSTLIVDRSSELGGSIIGKSWEISKAAFVNREVIDQRITESARFAGDAVGRKGTAAGSALTSSSVAAAKDLSSTSAGRSAKAFSHAGESFVVGYAMVPARLKGRISAMGDNLTDAGFAQVIREENDRRSRLSEKSVDLISETFERYPESVSGSFSKAGEELRGNYRTTGLSLSVLRSIRWVLQGMLWDATIKPTANIAAASLGYIGVNLMAFPALVVVRESVATAGLAVEVVWDTAGMGYDIVAPTGIAAVASLYGILDMTGSNMAAGAIAAGGGTIGTTIAVASKTAGAAVKGGGVLAGKTVRYVGVPLASAGITLGGGTIGTAVGGAGIATGGAVRVTGETVGTATALFGNVIAGTTLVGGTAVSTAGGGAYGVYELSKAVVVPAGYEVGGGVVLSYGTMTHLATHSILAVSDCAYLVLSLEGPRWVLYAVKGVVSNGDDLPAGAVVDLKTLRDQGEELSYLPVSDEEMKQVVESMYDNLPEQPEQ